MLDGYEQVTIKVILEGDNLTTQQRQEFYINILNSLNAKLIPVISIVNEAQEKEVFNNTEGFIK